MDLNHVYALTHIVQADTDECELLWRIHHRIGLLNKTVDELEFKAVQLMVKSLTTYGGSEVYEWAQGVPRTK